MSIGVPAVDRKRNLLRGPHTGTEFPPMEIHFEEKKLVACRGCKQTKNPPFCDGSHLRI
jgi:CDGSH-type Zn-finger protein